MMENVRGKNTRRKHLSKNKKKSWRKVDTTELDDFLEDERQQERTGGKVAEKPDASLFFVDKKVDKKKKDDRLTRKRKAQEELKDLEVGLKPPPPKRKDKRLPKLVEKEASGKLTVTQKRALTQRRQARRATLRRAVKRNTHAVITYDLWGDTLELETKGEDSHFLDTTKKSRVKAPQQLKKPSSLVPAVEVPHPGMSYNPDYNDYKDLLSKAHTKELKKQKVEEKIKRALDAKFPSAKDAPTEESRLEEMSAGLFNDSVEEDEEVGDLDHLSVNPPVRRENKKDERKRKKEKALKEQAKLAEKEKQKRMKNNNFFRLKTIKKEIKEKEKQMKTRASKRGENRAQEPYRTKTLSRTKFEEPDLELKLSDELVGSLREIQPEGHLLIDRFNSLMKRNILEVRGTTGKKQKRKFKPKVFEKKSHKEIK